MEADYSVELAADDPSLEFPWTDPDGRIAYLDLKTNPELIPSLSETGEYPELCPFLKGVNSAGSIFKSVKCDVFEDEIAESEGIFGASSKLGSYIDLVVDDANAASRYSFELHESVARRLATLLGKAPEMPASVEIIVRRCYFGAGRETGFYWTVYVFGFGDDPSQARARWAIALDVVKNAVLQLSAEQRRASS